jgi:hypothetical protein
VSAVGYGFFGKENEGGNPDSPGNKEEIVRMNLETPPQGSEEIDPFPRFALGEPICAPPDYFEEESQRPVFPYAVNAQGSSEQRVTVFAGAHHNELPGLTI